MDNPRPHIIDPPPEPRRPNHRAPYPQPIPKPAPGTVHAIEQFLMDRFDITRPPEKAAALLATIVALAKREQTFPPRFKMAAALDCSPYGIDNALSTALARGLITHRVEVAQGNMKRRGGGVQKLRYFEPSIQLWKIYDYAETKWNDAQATQAALPPPTQPVATPQIAHELDTSMQAINDDIAAAYTVELSEPLPVEPGADPLTDLLFPHVEGPTQRPHGPTASAESPTITSPGPTIAPGE